MLALDHSPVGSSPEILDRTLVFKGTRVPAQTLLDYFSDGFSVDEFLVIIPSIRREVAEPFPAVIAPPPKHRTCPRLNRLGAAIPFLLPRPPRDKMKRAPGNDYRNKA
jgi:hypothetical protein